MINLDSHQDLATFISDKFQSEIQHKRLEKEINILKEKFPNVKISGMN